MMKMYRREEWGVSTWSWPAPGRVDEMKQTAAAPGMRVEYLLGRELSEWERVQYAVSGQVCARP